jgi:hypothetical protein
MKQGIGWQRSRETQAPPQYREGCLVRYKKSALLALFDFDNGHRDQSMRFCVRIDDGG